MKKQKLVYPTPKMNELFDVIREIQSKEEAVNFFRDLLTLSELTEFANRWQMVKLLCSRVSYADIAKKLSVSTATVTRVARWLKKGRGGYAAIASRVFDDRPNPDYREQPRFKSGKLRGMKNPLKL
ncbi:helix-turn-helix domain-containing protein [Patescibacteria group bacterium]|nr:helix-turn-helix domain-containing protein [Patescibacteria group bacterium]MBU1472470.1 helix-turn-helix domain-containing protein [Patescibacteria group bacterium]MBU2460284.1 helix-turn-helix domain-containing protein [Patescibacteria group bacterium]MBU2543858.1 helix-turn-helix domain-containing protein [Patescibacteria group bacterium]